MLFAVSAITGGAKRCLMVSRCLRVSCNACSAIFDQPTDYFLMFQIHVHEAIVIRCLSDKRRKAASSFQTLSDVVQERMKEMDRTKESARTGSEERVAGAGKVGDEAAASRTAMNTMRDKMQQTSAEPDANRGAENVTQEEWLTIYRFHHMVPIRLFCRFKIYQTAFTVSVGLISLLSHLLEVGPTSALIPVLAVSAFTTLSLYIVGHILRHFIGFVYLSPDQKWVKIAHIDFWGRRQNHVLSVSHIVALKESPSAFKFVRQLFISEPNSSSKYYVFVLKESTFAKPEVFADIFGIDVAEISNNKAQETEDKIEE